MEKRHFIIIAKSGDSQVYPTENFGQLAKFGPWIMPTSLWLNFYKFLGFVRASPTPDLLLNLPHFTMFLPGVTS